MDTQRTGEIPRSLDIDMTCLVCLCYSLNRASFLAGVRMSVSDKVKFTKEGLLDVAGSRKVRAFSTPYEGDFRDVAPVEMSLEDYTDFLDQRDLSDEIRQNFSYVFERLPDDEGPLSFARSPPKLFKDQILLRSAQFTLGGQLMGSTLPHTSSSTLSPQGSDGSDCSVVHILICVFWFYNVSYMFHMCLSSFHYFDTRIQWYLGLKL